MMLISSAYNGFIESKKLYICITLKKQTMKNNTYVELIPVEYNENETTEVFEPVLFVTQVAKDVEKLPLNELLPSYRMIEKCWNLQIKKDFDMRVAKLILLQSVTSN